jgi:murein DD-endopeptidase MepM/ murein hydrolase activator NlpD
LVLVVICSLMMGAAGSSAFALNKVQQANRRERSLTRHLNQTRKHTHTGEVRLLRKISAVRRTLKNGPRGAQGAHFRRPVTFDDRALTRKLAWLQRILHSGRHKSGAEVRKLLRARAAVRAWLNRYGIFSVCPVRGPRLIEDNFGVIIRLPGVPVHVHQGDDIVAPLGTPVVAPFAGYASIDDSVLGGMGVKVTGRRGYVFQAHLESLGQLGWVKAGTIVGYVGETGDAFGPHDHFEWHPNGGPAVDPNPFLLAVCS